MQAKSPVSALRTILAVLPPLGAFILQWLFWPYMQPYVWFLLYPAIFFSSWIGGLSGGLAATAISTGLAWYFFIPPEFSFAVEHPKDFASIGVFMGMGVLFSLFHDRLRKTAQQAADALIALRSAHEQLESRGLEGTASLLQPTRSLRVAEARLHSVLRMSHLGGWELDLVDHTAYRTLEHDRIFGYSSALPQWTYEMFLAHVLPEDRAEVDRRFRESAAAQTDWNFECRIRRVDGEVRWILAAGEHQRDEAGQMRRMAGIVQDITERKQAEQARRESEERFRLLIEGLKDYAIIMLDPQGHVASWNEGARRLKGYAEAEIVGRSVECMYTPEDIAAGKPAHFLARAAAEGRCENEGWRVRKDGTRFFADVVLTAMRNTAGELVGFAKITRDVTERREAEQKVREEMRRAEALLEAAPDPVVIVNGEGRIVIVNARAEAVFQYSREELLGQPVELLIPERLHAEHIAHRAPYQENPTARAMGAGRDLFARRKDGSEFTVDVRLNPVATSDGTLIISTVRDVTERVGAQQALRDSETFSRATMNALLANICVIDEVGKIVAVNQRWRDFAAANGVDPDKVSEGTNYLAVCAAATSAERASSEVLAEGVRGVALGAMGSFNVEYPCHSPKQQRWFRASVNRFLVGQAVRVVIAHFDITERVQAEQKVRGQLEHLNLLGHITRATGERQDLKSIFQVVVTSLENSLPIEFGCICLYDSAANAIRMTCVGAKSEPLAHELMMDEQASIDVDANGLGRCVRGELVHEPDIGQLPFPFPARLARGGLGSLVMAPLRSESRVFGVLVAARRDTNAFSDIECEFLRQLSEHVALAAHQAQLYGALQQAYDDLRQTQQVMMQEERLRALGQMASGIAHDINNALSPVSLYTESMLETEGGLSENARGYLQTIQRAVEDVAQTVARMREFYRPREQQLELAPVDANQMLQQVLDLTRARWSDMTQNHGIVIQAQTEPAPNLPKIMGIESEIREALTNLVLNAVDAMPAGGTMTLRSRLADSDPQRPSVVIEVIDTGVGMDEETRRRCLEPFFTTKGERGTGLGLAMVFGMVQRHSAEMEIDSAPGAGTTVRLVFAVPTEIPAEPGLPARARVVPSPLRLLLVDDDPLLLKSLRDALETDGHLIVTANGGEAGIAAFRAALDRGETFAAVITDLGMPHVDGRRVAIEVKEVSPAMPVIMLTGWGQRLIAEGDIPPGVDRVLAKPPKLREVREALAQLCQPAAA